MTSDATEASEKTCHISVVRKRTTEKIMSRGIARVSSASEETSWLNRRASAHRRIDRRP